MLELKPQRCTCCDSEVDEVVTAHAGTEVRSPSARSGRDVILGVPRAWDVLLASTRKGTSGERAPVCPDRVLFGPN